MGPEDLSNRNKIPIFFFNAKFSEIARRFQNVSLKIESNVPQKLGLFFSLFFMRKTLSSGQKWFLRPYFPPSARDENLRQLLNRDIPPN